MASSKKPVQLALLGCGTVGGGVLRLLPTTRATSPTRVGAPLVVRKVLVRDLDKERVPECDRAWLTTNPDEVLDDPDDRRRGRGHGRRRAGRTTTSSAPSTRQGRRHREQDAARRHGRTSSSSWRSSAASTSRSRRRSAAASPSSARCARRSPATGCRASTASSTAPRNYILTRMREDGLALRRGASREAQAKGYAEADPTLDVDGHDAAHKLVGARDARVRRARSITREVPTEGIRAHRADRSPVRRSLRLRHQAPRASGAITASRIELRVHPALVPQAQRARQRLRRAQRHLPRGPRARPVPRLRARRGRHADRGQRGRRHRRRRALEAGRRRRALDAGHLARGAAARAAGRGRDALLPALHRRRIVPACSRASPARSASTA